MNERIEKLAEQCRGNPMTSEFEPRFDRKKFAEWISRECADCVDFYTSDGNGPASDVILNHFGVEE